MMKQRNRRYFKIEILDLKITTSKTNISLDGLSSIRGDKGRIHKVDGRTIEFVQSEKEKIYRKK